MNDFCIQLLFVLCTTIVYIFAIVYVFVVFVFACIYVSVPPMRKSSYADHCEVKIHQSINLIEAELQIFFTTQNFDLAAFTTVELIWHDFF